MVGTIRWCIWCRLVRPRPLVLPRGFTTGLLGVVASIGFVCGSRSLLTHSGNIALQAGHLFLKVSQAFVRLPLLRFQFGYSRLSQPGTLVLILAASPDWIPKPNCDREEYYQNGHNDEK